ncbi:hypothetical protein KAT24_01380 [Candidatus Pacearchaeota archaeon]|nr:hypothetical protein [Candidatus Pacearchaeota archaeon]
MDIERKLLWWKYIESEIPQLFGWNFLLINEPREIQIITNNICYALEIVEEKREIDFGLIENSRGLRYDLFTMYSPAIEINFKEIYTGLVKKDRRLQKRETRDGWNYLINQIVCGEI